MLQRSNRNNQNTTKDRTHSTQLQNDTSQKKPQNKKKQATLKTLLLLHTIYRFRLVKLSMLRLAYTPPNLRLL